jgi:predicted nucleic acid-binding protein
VAVTTWLIDKSAYTRLPDSPDAQVCVDRIERGTVRISTVTRLEIGYSFRTAVQARSESVSPPLALMPVEYLTPAVEIARSRCNSCWQIVASIGAPSIPDLLVAATAEVAELTILALDKDFELIAQITGQPVESLYI